MKLIAIAAAGLIATATFAATPAQAQYRYGWDRGYERHWDGRDRDWRGDRRWRGDRHWRGDGYWRGDRHWRHRHGWRGRSVVRCRWVHDYYGPVRRCFRIYR